MSINYNTSTHHQKGSALRLQEWAGLLLLLLCCFYWFATQRLIARDEGFYALASQLVSNGDVPYGDFFYPQMPLLPYVYGLWGKLVGDSYLNFRILSAIFSAVIGLQIYYLLKSNGVGTLFSVIALLLYVFSTLTFSCFTTVQTYSLSMFFLLSSLLFLQRAEVRWSALFLGGLSLGLAGMVRLYFVGLLPVLLLIFPQTRKSLAFYSGFFILYPFLFLFSSWDVLWFNNVGYHLMRSTLTLSESLGQKWHVAEALLGLRSSVKFDGWQYQILLYGALTSTLVLAKTSQAVRTLACVGFGLFFISLMPSPTYVQYFCVTVPFFAALIALLLRHFYYSYRWGMVLFICALLGVYLFSVPADIRRYTVTGEGVIGISNKKNAEEWNLRRLAQVQEMLGKQIPASSEIAALWPGHLVGTEFSITPGLENHFGFLVADKLSEDERARFQIVSKKDLQEKIITRQIPYLLSWRRLLRSGFLKALKKGEYEKIDSAGDIVLYARKKEN